MSWCIGTTISIFNCNIGLSFSRINETDAINLFNEQKNKKNDVDIFIKLKNIPDTHSISDFIKFTSKIRTDLPYSSCLIIAKNLKSSDTSIYDCYCYCDSSGDFLYLVDSDDYADDVYLLVDT
jgi:hypothetical protein